MNRKIRWLLAAGFGALLSAQGCVVEEVDSDDDSKSTGSGDTPEAKAAGQRCGCDAECAGDGALCLLGMCATRAQGFCTAPGTELGCAPGNLCFNTDILLDSGVCLPLYDPNVCELVQNRHGTCSPTRADGCDSACGITCLPDQTAPGTAGAQCGSDAECGFHLEGQCYSAVPGDPNGWVDGYCLAFGCGTHEECGGPEKGCFLVAADETTGVCMERCGMDLDCRAGYTCRILDDGSGNVCFAGCDDASSCPAGNTCLGDTCVDDNYACGEANPTGWCPDGSWCDNGVCNSEPFNCSGEDDSLEPNGDLNAAVEVSVGETAGLRLCGGDEDWYKVVVPAGKIWRVGIEFANGAGDIDLVAYDGAGALLGSRIGKQYPYSYRAQETDIEHYGFYSKNGGETFFVRVVGSGLVVENTYALEIAEFDYLDGSSCTDSGFTFDECVGQQANGAGLIPFPFPDPGDGHIGGGYIWDTFSNYRFARRELVMAIRDAMYEVELAFPETDPLGLIDVCQFDGITPGYDVGEPRHPETTHDQGGNIDIAYYQTDGNNSSEVICGDGSVHADGFCSSAAVEQHIVDLPRQAFFMAKLHNNPRLRVVGVDKIIAPLIQEAAEGLNALPESDPQHITSSELSKFSSKMAYGDGWPYHHHHIHVSFNWWTGAHVAGAEQADGNDDHNAHRMMAPHMPLVAPGATNWSKLDMSWPPAPRVQH